jgi:hypothetical protein
MSEYFRSAPSIDHKFYSEIMDEYIDMNIVMKRLKDGQYKGMFSFKQDIRNIWYKAYQYNRFNPQVIEAVAHLRRKFKQMARELDDIPIKRF